MQTSRPTRVEINMDNFRNNIKEIRNFISKDVKLAIVLKGNGYGHGAVELIKMIEEKEIDYICVATLSEAMELRNNNIKSPILILGYVGESCLCEAIKNNITLTVFDKNQGIRINEEAKLLNKKSKIHLKVDTGFNRLGFKQSKDNNILKDILDLINLENIIVEGIFTHLALTNEETDYEQYKKFINIINEVENYKKIPIKHICDSISMSKYKDFHMDMVRVGACIYGYSSKNKSLKLKEIMTLKSKIIQIKEVEKGEGISYDFTFKAKNNMKIGIVPCGYGDGLPRQLSNKGYAMINNKKVNIIGSICMDNCIIDITNLEEGDYTKDVIFYGENGPQLEQIAKLVNTNKNEILSRISKRVIKVYIDNGTIVKIVDDI